MMISGYIKHLRTALTALAALPLLAGCASDPDVPTPPVDPADNPNELILRMKVAFASAGMASRATDPSGFEGPEGDFEKISTLRVIIIRNLVSASSETNPDYIEGEVEANRLVATDDNGNPRYDNLNFPIEGNEDKRVYLIANEASLPTKSNFTLPDNNQQPKTSTEFLDKYYKKGATVDLIPLKEWIASMPATESGDSLIATSGFFSPENLDNRLPLTEFFDFYAERNRVTNTGTVPDDEADSNKPQQTVDYCDVNLFITRAAAKASFYISNESSTEANYTITGIKLQGVGVNQYVFPNTATYLPKTKEEFIEDPSNKDLYIANFKTPADAPTATYLVNFAEFDTETGKYVGGGVNVASLIDGATAPVLIPGSLMYFPESILAAGAHYTVGVQLNGDPDLWLYAPLETNILTIDNGSDARDAIARDTHLKINITLKNINSQIYCTVDLVPYKSVYLTPSFGF